MYVYNYIGEEELSQSDGGDRSLKWHWLEEVTWLVTYACVVVWSPWTNKESEPRADMPARYSFGASWRCIWCLFIALEIQLEVSFGKMQAEWSGLFLRPPFLRWIEFSWVKDLEWLSSLLVSAMYAGLFVTYNEGGFSRRERPPCTRLAFRSICIWLLIILNSLCISGRFF